MIAIKRVVGFVFSLTATQSPGHSGVPARMPLGMHFEVLGSGKAPNICFVLGCWWETPHGQGSDRDPLRLGRC